ncbi:Uma2 family endonuclease [Stieleria sp. ICT_E10.1]|uniref:Uma2 family endonuclease n=1 Tax=Stieleria sedimenti TaxID=2976331 RepID=UPI00217F9867|nr:Uma2 family endonuclease [Stieleria sedimenti]MCS7471606.1 Uma2 family endonuclease [Stieleria sedimenti]
MSSEPRASRIGEPTWEIAKLYPRQGAWSESDYLGLDAGRLVEFENGVLEILRMPTELHQAISLFLWLQIRNFIDTHSHAKGVCLVAPLPVRLWDGKFREPDVLYMSAENRTQRTPKFWKGADLVMEIVSESDPDRDWIEKRYDYAKAGITEYWIVDPRDRSITVLGLAESESSYHELSRNFDGQTASSRQLDGFAVGVSTVFDRPEVIQ